MFLCRQSLQRRFLDTSSSLSLIRLCAWTGSRSQGLHWARVGYTRRHHHHHRQTPQQKMAGSEVQMKDFNVLKTVLEKREKPSMGCWQMIPGVNVARLLARTGVDWILVDCEHGNIDDAAMHDIVPSIASCGVSPIVRIPDNQGWMVKRALDAGAHGVLVPLIYTVSDAQSLVKAAKFPPVGQRGFGSPFPMERFHPSLTSSDYLKQANSSILVCVQIETKEALEDVDAIAAIPGIDVLFVGPFDLGNNIGRPIINGVMHDELENGIKSVLTATNKHGKHAGIFCTSGEQARKYAEMGFRMVSAATDFMVLQKAVGEAVDTGYGRQAEKVISGPYGR